jgi:glycosyltransferase involved in cell wall biosynthesis
MVVFSSYPADPRPRRAAEALLKEGMSIDLLCEAEEGLLRRERIGSLEIIRIPVKRSRSGVISYAYQYSAFILIAAFIMAWRYLRHHYDLVYVHNMPDILVVCALFPKLFGAKVILDQHDPMPELMRTIFHLREKSFGVWLIRFMEKWSIACADLVITVNVACKRLFATRSCPQEKIGVVMNSPDAEIFPHRTALSYPLRHAGDRFVIMYHGSLVERNGAGLIVDALAQLRQTVPTVELRVYGRSTPYLEQVMDKVRRFGLTDCVRYLGPKRLEDLAYEIAACDVGVIPNQQNPFTDINTPTRIFEYLALGKPVIAPRTLGIEDYFGRGSLFFFESGNAEELARTLEEVYSYPDRAVASAIRGQDVYLKHTWREERQTLVKLVSGLLARA